MPGYFLGCKDGRLIRLEEPSSVRGEPCRVGNYAASPGLGIVVTMDAYGNRPVLDSTLRDTLGTLPRTEGGEVLSIDPAARTIDLLGYGRGARPQWRRVGFSGESLDSASLSMGAYTVEEPGWGRRLVCAAADTAATRAPCWKPSAPGLEALVRAQCSLARCAWEPAAGTLLAVLSWGRALWMDPAAGTRDTVEWLGPALDL